MNNTDKYKRDFARVLTLLMLLAALFVTDIPVSADTTDSATVSSISAVTEKAEIKASSNTALKISWEKCPLAQGYVIYRRESTRKAFRRIKKVSASRTSYIDKRLISSKPYQYAVRAIRKENGRYVYSRYLMVTGATRPATVKTTIKAASSSTMKVTWKKSSRADGYRIYRRPAAGKWVLVADVAKNLTSYTDTGLNASTKYVYTVRPYKKGGNVKYMSAVKLSNKASTPAAPKVTPSGDTSNSSVMSNTRFTAAQKDVMKKILYAVETGGQVYGNQKYGDFTEAFTNSSTEYTITIGAVQWYGTEAQRLLKLIHATMGEDEWNKIDTGNHYVWTAVCNEDWTKYRIPKSSWRARVIVKLLQTDAGIKCQDQLMYQQIDEYEAEVRKLGVSDPQAVGMFINIRHQGGYGAVTRVLGKTAKPVNLINVYRALATDSGGQVGTYKTRQAKVYQWLLTYMK